MVLLISIFVHANEKKEEDNIASNKQQNNLFSFFKNIVKYKSNIQEHNIKEGKSYLKGEATIEYNNTKIQADSIEFNWKNGDIYAIKKEKPIILKIGNHQYTFSNIYTNINSNKVEAKNFYLQEKDYIITATNITKKDPNTSLIKKITYISDPFFLKKKDNDPDFYLKTDYLKYFHSKKYIFSGPVFFFWYKVPMPIFIPFLYIPVKKDTKDSKATYGLINPKFEIKNKKIFIKNIGFFFPISNCMNFKISSSIDSTKKWELKTRMEYKLRYAYHGFIDFNYDRYMSNSNNYQFKWEHNQDIKSDSEIDFNANINYNNNILFINHDYEYFSYINMRKKFSNYLLFMNAYMIQKSVNNKMEIKFIIPEFIFQMKNIFLEKKYFLRHVNIENKVSIHNSVNYTTGHFHTGLNHNMNISTYFYFFYPYLKILPKFFYEEFYTWEHKNSSISGFQKIDFLAEIISIPFNRIFEIKKNSIFLRHRIEPMFYFHMKYFPSIFRNEKNYKEINFILNNDLDFKFNELKKIKILNNLSTSFIHNKNFIKCKDLHFFGKTDFLQNLGLKYKGGINFSEKKEKNNMIFFDFSFYCNYNTNFFEKNEYKKKGKNRYDCFFFDEKNYAKYSIPLSLRIDFHSHYENDINQKKLFNTFLSMNGSVNITKYWKININTDYDLYNNKITFANIIFYRDLRSFKMSFNWIPMGSWSFFIGIKDPNLSNIIQYNEKS